MESKYIHYCWFGGKPLSKLTKKCIKSWKKYLPDYKIIRWDESNVDFTECPFVKEAYENKKWAFVADYARTKALYNMGGIYFDTDMMITKPIDFLLKNETFLGLEDSFMVNSAVWGASTPKTYLSKKLLDFYQSQEHFDKDNMFKVAIPRLITNILNEIGLDHRSKIIQELNHNITIYPRDYFYPLSFDFKDNLFTNNTCMVHYFDASWFSKRELISLKLNRLIGERKYRFIKKIYHKCRRIAGYIIKRFFYKPAKYVKYTYLNNGQYKKDLNKTKEEIKKVKNDFIILHNPDWLGITSATIELFDKNRIPCKEFFRRKDIRKVGNLILKQGITQVIFSAMCIGWKDMAHYIHKRNPNIKFKVFWHGSISQVYEPYGWARNLELIEMSKEGILEVFGTCKESLVSFYENLGIQTAFIRNNVTIKEIIRKENKNKMTFGLYASSTLGLKNLYSQVAAISLFKNATVDIVPKNTLIETFAKNLGLKVTGCDKTIPRTELLKRMSKNTLNLYVTFTECSPMLPLESFEMGTICITGNNHHYFKNTELEKYLVVNNEESPIAISERIKKCIENERLILDKYKEWKKENNELSKKSVQDFLEM